MIEKGSDTQAWGVIVPGLPSCFSAGDTLEEALSNTREAIELHLDGVLDNGGTLPEAVTLESIAASKDYRNMMLAVVDVDMKQIGGKVERVNITLP